MHVAVALVAVVLLDALLIWIAVRYFPVTPTPRNVEELHNLFDRRKEGKEKTSDSPTGGGGQ
jgi:hypothetical protein